MIRFLIGVITAALIAPAAAFAGDPPAGKTAEASQAAAPAAEHRYFTPADLKWTDAPPSLPKGAKVSMLEGDLAAPGPFAVRISFPAGYKIPPHSHPAIEHVTIISGSFFMGMGETWDESKGHEMPAGSFGYMLTGVKHFAWTKVETVVQVHGIGPWGITYVNASDDPRNQKQATK